MARLPHHLITFSGYIGPVGQPVEFWSTSVRTTGDPAATAGLSISAMDALADACQTCWATNLAPVLSGDVRLTQTKIAAVESVAGQDRVKKRADGSYQQGISDGLSYGALSILNMPPQSALVVTLDTTRAGATGKGRMFLPPTHAPLAEDKRISVANANTVAFGVAEFLRDLTAAGAGGFGVVCVASSKGYHSFVTGVRVGRAYDTLRSRRRNLDEGYVSASL